MSILNDIKNIFFGMEPSNSSKAIFDSQQVEQFLPFKEMLEDSVTELWYGHLSYEDIISILRLYLVDMCRDKDLISHGKRLIAHVQDLYTGAIPTDRSNLGKLLQYIYHYNGVPYPFLFNTERGSIFNALSNDQLDSVVLNKLTKLFKCDHKTEYTMQVSSAWAACLYYVMQNNPHEIYDPGHKIYKIVESYRYFDIMNMKSIFEKVRPLTATVPAQCMFELCKARFKIDERLADMIKNSAATSKQLKKIKGFYCCDDHAIADRNVGREELRELFWIVLNSWKNRKIVSTDGVYNCPHLIWHGHYIPCSEFVAGLANVDSQPSLKGREGLIQLRFCTPFYLFGKLENKIKKYL